MEDYDKLLNSIKSYLEYDDVSISNKCISIYDLEIIFKKECKKYNSLIEVESKLLKKIINKDNRKSNLINRLKRDNEKSYFNRKCEEVSFYLYNQTIEMRFSFFDCLKESSYGNYYKKCKYFEIDKDLNSNLLKYKIEKDSNNFVNKYSKEIFRCFTELENIYNELKEDVSKNNGINHEIIFSDSLLKITFSYTFSGTINIIISLVETADPSNVYYIVSKDRKSIENFVEANKDKLLKKIPVFIDDLDYPIRKMLESYISIEKVLTR